MMNDRRILVVEDDPDGQVLVAYILEHLRLPIDVAADFDTALGYLQQPDRYRAIIIDLALPGRDGWDLLQAIQGNEETATLPCIAVTAFHTSKIREQALKAGFVAYFSKPLDAVTFSRQFELLL